MIRIIKFILYVWNKINVDYHRPVSRKVLRIVMRMPRAVLLFQFVLGKQLSNNSTTAKGTNYYYC